MQWVGFIFKALFYAVCIAVLTPILILFQLDQRQPTVDDGVDLGYDDNDLGKDVDE